jgi:hypothetical protein
MRMYSRVMVLEPASDTPWVGSMLLKIIARNENTYRHISVTVTFFFVLTKTSSRNALMSLG